MSSVSVLILTKNEEQDLPGCIRSVSWSDDIVVYDSFSTDRTQEIARTGVLNLFKEVLTTGPRIKIGVYAT
jgi:glycosyltransferase involved in cell wall biosynthesis